MKLVEALQTANSPQHGPEFSALLACGFTPLHLETAVKAHLRSRLPDRTVVIKTGLFGDLAGTLENAGTSHVNCILIALEWADLDPRLGWRSIGPITDRVVSDVRDRLDRIAAVIEKLAPAAPTALALPALPLAPVFHIPGNEMHRIEARIKEMVYGLAALTRATVVHVKCFSSSTHDLRSDLLTGFPYSFAYADELAASFVRTAVPQTPKKGLISDLDETMWKGVLGDDGPEGIAWDLENKAAFHGAYQHVLNSLAEAGVLIGIASRNDESLVRQAFERTDLILKPERLFPVEAHWNPKTQSVARTLEAWNVMPDSVVFVDDNPLELEQVRATFPTMECIRFRENDPNLFTELLNHFGKRVVLQEDLLRAESLRTAGAVREATGNGANLDSLLASAQAKIVFRWSKQPDPRSLELVNKTNQFNLNGIRYGEVDWKNFLSDPSVYVATVEYEDRFGKLGKIAVIAGREQDSGFLVETWVMSCRAFSRRIEHQCLKTLLQRWKSVALKFTRTERNGPMQDFLEQIGAVSITASQFELRCPQLFHATESLHV